MTDNPMLNAALDLAARGFPVLQVKPGSKLPLRSKRVNGANWGATRDRDLITRYWDSAPRANVGIATGFPLAVGEKDRLFVIDIDGPEGLASLHKLTNGRPWTQTPSVKTARGHHIYLRAPFDVKTCNWLPGVDIRGTGGYVLAPPSIRADKGGFTYQWEDADLPIAEPPIWLDRHLPLLVNVESIPSDVMTMVQGDAKDMWRAINVVVGEDTWRATIESIEPVIMQVNADIDYHDWLAIGMALHKETDGGQEGLDLWDKWSSGGSKYKRHELPMKWRTFTLPEQRQGKSVGYGTILDIAKQQGVYLGVNSMDQARPQRPPPITKAAKRPPPITRI